MRKSFHLTSLSALGLSLAFAGFSPVFAQDNPEDDPIPDEDVSTVPATPSNPIEPPVATPPTTPSATATPITPSPETGASARETVTIPRAVWEGLLRDVETLKNSRSSVATTPTAPSTSTTETGAASGATATDAGGSRNYLLLPDISFVGNSQYLFSSDKRDTGRNSLDTEGELGIQGYVYPNVKYDTFIVGNPGAEEFGVEEGYLTYLSAAKGLNVQIGRKFAPFGRTGELHPHSWLYSRQFIARQNLIAPENLVGNGINLNYLLPTGKKFFARLSLGAFSAGESASGRLNTSDPSDPFEGSAPNRIGAGLSRFYNARLWTGTSIGPNNEIEFGASRAQGRAFLENFSGVDKNNNEIVDTSAGRLNLSGLDFSFRRFMGTGKRLLVRGELFKYDPRGLPTHRSSGSYLLSNYRFDKFNDVGLLLEKSDFVNAPGAKETATSLIYTRIFSERYYVRFTGTRGDRPGASNYTEGRVQFVIGLGPHTHELE
ncbi:hypothetical protein B1R32_11027 [Abditibacterium utsteinense]|uniref:Uncharacterized protein n=1 Tax=Abditibacterium utsteinense TaxID=1960156 RepID=A0A2S8SRY3_9BACT|nr:hypothetical protein [Abditibacterium utsteinense]PQV63564.1 hypothetical protein B1R32_11027 [Abditibacterium utsteinense]